jgi:hypothetical protein
MLPREDLLWSGYSRGKDPVTMWSQFSEVNCSGLGRAERWIVFGGPQESGADICSRF